MASAAPQPIPAHKLVDVVAEIKEFIDQAIDAGAEADDAEDFVRLLIANAKHTLSRPNSTTITVWMDGAAITADELGHASLTASLGEPGLILDLEVCRPDGDEVNGAGTEYEDETRQLFDVVMQLPACARAKRVDPQHFDFTIPLERYAS